jgi:PAS domain S-box-containing protein
LEGLLVANKPSYEEIEQRVMELERQAAEHKQAEKALRESERFLIDVFNSIQEGLDVIDTDFHILRVNAWLEKMYSSEMPLIGKKCYQAFQNRDTLCPYCPCIKAIDDGENHSTIVPYPSHDNPLGWLELTAYPFKDAQGRIIGIIEYSKDITGLKKADKALHESEELFKAIFNNAGFGIAVADKNGKFSMVNNSMAQMLGTSKDELIGASIMDITYPEDIELSRKHFESLFQGETDSYRMEKRYIRKDGSVLWVDLSVSHILDEDGGTKASIGMFSDITDRKRAEEEQKKLQAQLVNAVEIAHLGPWEYDVANDLFTFNDYFYKIFRTTAEQVGGYTMKSDEYARRFVHPDEIPIVGEETRKAIEATDPNFSRQLEHRILYADGTVGWITVRFFIVKDANGQTVKTYGVNQDITERKKAEEALRESEEKLVRSKKMESMGLLAGGVAHDLNNVLSGIVSYPELLLMDLPEDSKLRRPIQTMQESGHRAVAIVQDLLTVARGIATTKEPLNLNDIVSDYLVSPEFEKLKQFHPAVTVKTSLDADLLNISGATVHIRKVVMNLVSNASEAIEGKGNVTISTMNRCVDRPLRGYNDVNIGEYAVLTVADDGSGISSDDLERIFEPFYTKKVMGRSGTGLGLAVVWNVVQEHNGYIDVISDENGTTFELYFPITRDEVSDRKSSVPIKDYKGDGETILVIDDVESQREISCTMLDTLGYKTKAVSSGEEAVEYLKEHTADLLLLDMIMDPGINGRETYERIVKTHPNQKAIIISGFAETDEVKKTQKLGAGKYVKKPITLEKIGLAVREELEKYQF